MPDPGAKTADPHALAEGLKAGRRRDLARAITLIESTRPDHRAAARALLEELLPATGGSIRLGISGVPGVGKSTFIEAFGRHVIDRGHRIAVLAVDPTSARSGGSILGDKTRMEELARAPEAFIRPSPAGDTLGGVARRTREAMLACEAAGFDVIVVETVGVGQSETAVADMVDLFCLLLLPGGGDELQGIKRGIVEIADLIVVNKADGAMRDAARHAAAEYRHALTLLRPRDADWRVLLLQAAATENRGIDAVWETIGRWRRRMPPRAAWPPAGPTRRVPGCGRRSARPWSSGSAGTRRCAPPSPATRPPWSPGARRRARRRRPCWRRSWAAPAGLSAGDLVAAEGQPPDRRRGSGRHTVAATGRYSILQRFGRTVRSARTIGAGDRCPSPDLLSPSRVAAVPSRWFRRPCCWRRRPSCRRDRQRRSSTSARPARRISGRCRRPARRTTGRPGPIPCRSARRAATRGRRRPPAATTTATTAGSRSRSKAAAPPASPGRTARRRRGSSISSTRTCATPCAAAMPGTAR